MLIKKKSITSKSKANQTPMQPSLAQRGYSVILELLSAHPYLCALAVCLMLNPLFLGSVGNIPSNAPMLVFFSILIGGVLLLYYRFRKGRLNRVRCIVGIAALTAADVMGTKFYGDSEHKLYWITFLVASALLILYGITAGFKNYAQKRHVLLILGLSFLIKLVYVLETSCYSRQHDVHSFGGDSGHAAYIEYLLYNHSLPATDPRDTWQFYHPPLHHAISAVWIWLSETLLGVGYNQARESLQMLTLFYAMAIVITAYRILRHFHLRGLALYAPLAVIAFHPSFIILSGSINNDVLSVVFMMGAALWTLKWYENQTLKGILKIALCIGLGMMTKMSAALIAFPVAAVFLIVLVQRLKQKQWHIFGQFGAFAAVCVPLGLWYPIRNLVKFGVPLNYVQEMSTNVRQYIGDQTFLSRIFDFSSEYFQDVFYHYLQYDNETGVYSSYNEVNPLLAILKTSMFDESCSYPDGASAFAPFLFWSGFLTAALAFGFLVFCLCRKGTMKPVTKAFLGVFYVAMIVSYYSLAKNYPFVCSMVFRYITPTVILGALCYGVFMQRISGSQKLVCRTASYALTAIAFFFALCSAIFFLLVGVDAG